MGMGEDDVVIDYNWSNNNIMIGLDWNFEEGCFWVGYYCFIVVSLGRILCSVLKFSEDGVRLVVMILNVVVIYDIDFGKEVI